jgi:hypothetical protein
MWSGGVATAVVAGLIALAGVFLSRWLLKIPLLAPHADGAYGNVHTTSFVLSAAGAAVVATGLAHLLLLSTPRPMTFFGWIIALATVVAVIYPFSTSAGLQAKAATAVVTLVIGIAIGTLLTSVSARAVRQRPPGGGYAAPGPGSAAGQYRPGPADNRYRAESPYRPEPGPQDGYRPASSDSGEGWYREAAPPEAPEGR